MNKAWQRRRNEFDNQTRGNILFRVWLGVDSVDLVPDELERQMFHKWYGNAPQFLIDSLIQWGGLTEKQYTFAFGKFNEVTNTGRQRYEANQARMQHAVASGIVWAEGRKEVALEILSIKEKMFGPKLLGKTPDGLKLWVSVPSQAQVSKGDKIKMTVTVKPSPDDPTFAFGSRPSKWAVL